MYMFLILQMYMEMERICITVRLQTVVRDSWSKLWTTKMIAQARREEESNSRLRQFMQEFPIQMEDGKCFLIGITIIM